MTTAIESYIPPLASPLGYGLYAAATVLDGAQRLAFGRNVRNVNCGPAGTWPLECDPTPDPTPAVKGGERTPDMGFAGVVVWGADDCGLLAAEHESFARQSLRLQEQVFVEEHLAGVLPTDAVTLTAAADLVAAVGALERHAGGYGVPGVIHASAEHAALAVSKSIAIRQGAVYVSPLGHRWAFGGGYDDLGPTLVVTGPVVVHRDSVEYQEGPDYQHNGLLAVAERGVLVTWECYRAKVTITP